MFDIFSSVKNVYDRIGVNFSASRAKMWPQIVPYTKKVPQKAEVLDLGCGNGRLLTSLPEGVSYTGVDFSKVLLSEALKKHPKQNFIEADISQEIVWKSLKKYDAIFCLAVLHHLSESKQLFVLKQIKKHLVSGGLVVITSWHLWQRKFFHNHLASWRLKFSNPNYLYVPFGMINRPCYAISSNSLKRMAAKAGFVNFKVVTVGDNLLLTMGVN